MKKASLNLFIGAVIGAFCFALYHNKKPEEKIVVERAVPPHSYQKANIQVPKALDFAGESVPLDRRDIFERLDKELYINTYWHSSTSMLIKRAERWLPLFEKILQKHGVPDDFKYIPVIESNLSNVVSPASAAGFWQLMRGTALENGMKVNSEIDERYDPVKSAEVAVRYLKEAHSRLGSWTNALASYNMGMYGLQKAMEQQKVNSYYDLYLSEETSRYVMRLLAVKIILENPKKYGFDISQENLYHPIELDTFELKETPTDLIDFALDKGHTYQTLKKHNPWIRTKQLHINKNEKYAILLPKKK